jgi:hypothetical protein
MAAAALLHRLDASLGKAQSPNRGGYMRVHRFQRQAAGY